jgi:nucleoside-diphosphate-sugar epimerase
VYHLAGQPGVRSFGGVFPTYVRQNILATQRVLEAAASAGVRVVFASSSSVYGDAAAYPTPEDTVPRPISPYGITKLAAEHLAYAYGREFGLERVVLRYFTIFGPRQRPDMALTRMVTSLAERQPFELYGDGTQSRSFTYVDDVVEATILAMESAPAGSTYNVGGGVEISLLDAIETLGRIAGRRLEVIRAPRVGGDVQRTSADTTRIQALGWEPHTSFDKGLEAQWRWAADRVAAR